MARDHALSEKRIRQSHPHHHCSGRLMTQDHAHSEEGTWQVILISIATGGPCHEITHHLRREHGKVMVIQHYNAELMSRDHVLPGRGT